jgi:hypothetical protein
MTNKEVWSSYEDYTRGLTSLTRQLAFGAAAICWFFKTPEATFPKPILVSLAFVVGFFFLDILQPFIAALRLRSWIHGREQELWNKTNSIEGEYEKPRTLDRWPFRLFIGKIVVLVAVFVALGVELGRRIA